MINFNLKDMTKKEEKYFMKGTDTEVKLGEWLSLDYSTEKEDVTIHHHLECVLSPAIIPALLEDGIIEKREIETKTTEPSDEEVGSGILIALIDDLEDLAKRVGKLEKKLENMLSKQEKKK